MCCIQKMDHRLVHSCCPVWRYSAEPGELTSRAGKIQYGYLADFALLDRDITIIEPHEIWNATVLMCVAASAPVHCSVRVFTLCSGLPSEVRSYSSGTCRERVKCI
jgi:hypothetical protein